MGRRGGPRPGTTALGLGLGLGLGLALLTACAGPDGPGRPDPAPASPAPSAALSASPSASRAAPSTVSDAELCATIVAHWSREVLDSGTYGDYQSMGLSNGQYEILRDVVDAARAVRRDQGAAAADELIDRRARTACAERYRDGTPTGGPWQ
ncbi:hypothetical protein ABZ372_17295 [Streptomyces sp. NPDC005921]|uniref:hypothetical protein n=1 Tax=Streptomyces sp. NPDC005827 TaxID=3157070 RepID=UPI0033ED299D